MPTIKRRMIPTNKNVLSDSKKMDLLLDIYSNLGYFPKDSPFTDEEERRRTWFDFRESLMPLMVSGARPGGFWDYEAPGKLRVVGKVPVAKPGPCYHTGKWIDQWNLYEKEEDALARMGLLTLEEIEDLGGRKPVSPGKSP